jgi:hypothetical protein
MMKISILVAGDVGGTLGRAWARKGHDVFFGVPSPLASARYIEPARMLCVQLAYGMGMGPKLRMKLLRG